MRFSYQLLKKYFSNLESPEKLADLLTLHLAETELNFLNKRPVLDVDLLPNRVCDCAGHFGLLKEIGALKGQKFNYPKIKIKESPKLKIKDLLEVEIKSQFCKRYQARVILNVKVEESPKWLKNILIDCGLRPINNVVDAVNYTMLLTGQPLHTFDFDKIAPISFKKSKKKILVRLAKENEEITTLDSKTYKINNNHLVIADKEKVLALAGIKGGKVPEVNSKTKNIVIESANFDPANIRKTSKELNLKTDASFRFERNLSFNLTDYSLDLAVYLISQIAGGEIVKGKIDEKNFRNIQQKKFLISLQDYKDFAGIKIKKEKILKILDLLGYKVKVKNDDLVITPPLYRTDLNVKEDVIGDVLRIIGFNQIPSLSLKVEASFKKDNLNWLLKNKIKELIKGFNLFETYNYSFISLKEAQYLKASFKNKLIEVLNPTSELFQYLRPTLVCNFLKNISLNSFYEKEFGFFEVNKIYFWDNNLPKEELVFSGVLTNKNNKNKNQEIFYKAKGLVEKIFNDLEINEYEFKEINQNNLNSTFLKEGAEIFVKRQSIGAIGYVKKDFLKFYDLKQEVVFWEIKVLPLKEYLFKEKKYKPISKFPPVKRDISFIIPKDISYKQIISVMKSASVKYLKEIELFDIYTDQKIGLNYKSLSFHLTFQAFDRTLTSEEVDKEIEKIIENLLKINAKIR